MGLCKCRAVTSLFCYDHTCNVCEKCLVEEHPRCIIRSYLQWLQDSDFDSCCNLCHGPLKEGEVIRLICYDLFHWECLDRYFRALPVNTAPAGYMCPVCSAQIIPPIDLYSPVADVVAKRLLTVPWGKIAATMSPYAQPPQHKPLANNDRSVTGSVRPSYLNQPMIEHQDSDPSADRYSSSIRMPQDIPDQCNSPSKSKSGTGASSLFTHWKRRLGIRPIAVMGRDFSRILMLLLVVMVILYFLVGPSSA